MSSVKTSLGTSRHLTLGGFRSRRVIIQTMFIRLCYCRRISYRENSARAERASPEELSDEYEPSGLRLGAAGNGAVTNVFEVSDSIQVIYHCQDKPWLRAEPAVRSSGVCQSHRRVVRGAGIFSGVLETGTGSGRDAARPNRAAQVT
jgi:hypothetical protein